MLRIANGWIHMAWSCSGEAIFPVLDDSDTLKAILNEQAVKMLGLEEPIGQSIWVQGDTLSKMQIIGVVKDFHFQSYISCSKEV